MVIETQTVFFLLLAFLLLQRLGELWLSARNVQSLIASGGVEHEKRQVVWMSAMHALWFAACALEVRFGAVFSSAFFWPALATFLLGQALRYAAILSLGRRWNVRIVTLPSAPPIRSGIYSFLKHPNYAGVILEIAAVPLLHGAWMTSLAFSFLNAVFLFFRIRAENKAVYG